MKSLADENKALRALNKQLAKVLDAITSCVEDELRSCGPDEVRQHPVLKSHDRAVTKARAILAKVRLGNRGQSVVELALVLPLFFLMAFGVVEFGRAFMVKNVLACAAREGARVAAVRGTDAPEVEAKVRRVLSAARVVPTSITATVRHAPVHIHRMSDPTVEQDYVVVSVSANFVIVSGKVLGMFPGTMPMTATSFSRDEVTP